MEVKTTEKELNIPYISSVQLTKKGHQLLFNTGDKGVTYKMPDGKTAWFKGVGVILKEKKTSTKPQLTKEQRETIRKIASK
jgi:hypothetical protein